MTAVSQRVLALVLGAAGLVWVWSFDPHRSGQPFLRCPLHAATGLSCPACGTTRLTHDVLHGDVAGAWRDNALVLLLSPLLVALVVRWFVLGFRGRDTRLVLPRGTVPALLGVAVAWTVGRNA